MLVCVRGAWSIERGAGIFECGAEKLEILLNDWKKN